MGIKKPIFRIIIAGGRDFNDYNRLKEKVDNLISEKRKTHQIYIVSGKARGADSLGEKYANENGLNIMEFPADWDKHGKSAGYKRNLEMAENADALIAFWDGESRGTKHMIDIAKEKNLPTRIIKYKKL
jgi:hypothetical protein